MVESTIEVGVRFLLRNAQDPEVVTSSAQTGDFLQTLIVGILILFACVCCLCFVRFCLKNYVATNSKNARNFIIFKTQAKKNWIISLIGFSIIAILACVIAFSVFGTAKAQATNAPNAVSGDLEYTDVINAYVDNDTGAVTFEEGLLTNISNHPDIKIHQIEVSKGEGINDGNCNWKINLDDDLIVNDELSDKRIKTFDPSFILENNNSAVIKISSNINADIAKQLVDQKVIKLSLTLEETQYDSSFYATGNGQLDKQLIKLCSEASYLISEDLQTLTIKDKYDTYEVKAKAEDGYFVKNWDVSPDHNSEITTNTTFTCNFSTDVIVGINFENGTLRTGCKIPSGWSFDEQTKIASKVYKEGKSLKEIEKEWEGVELVKTEKTNSTEQNYIAHQFVWPEGVVDRAMLPIVPDWTKQFWVSLNFNGGTLEELPLGWEFITLTEHGQDPVNVGAKKLFDVSTTKPQLIKDWGGAKPHIYGMNFTDWTWDIQTDAFNIQQAHEFSAQYEPMTPINVWLNLYEGGGLDGSVPTDWAYEVDEAKQLKGYKSSFLVGTNIDDIIGIWAKKNVKRFGYNFVDYLITYNGKSYTEDIIVEELDPETPLVITPQWTEQDKVKVSGYVTDSDGIKLPADTYGVTYVDTLGNHAEAQDIDIDYNSGKFEASLPVGTTGVFQFVDKVSGSNRVAQDLAIYNLSEELPNIGTMVVEYSVNIFGKVSLKEDKSETFPGCTVIVYSYTEENGVIVEEKFAGSTDKNSEYSVRVKANRQYYVTVESFDKDGSTQYSTAQVCNVVRENKECNIDFSSTTYKVSIDLKKGIIANSAIPTGYDHESTYVYSKLYCVGTSTNFLLNLWKSLPIKYDDETMSYALTSWTVTPDASTSTIGEETTIQANWADSVIVSGIVKNNFEVPLAGATVTMTLNSVDGQEVESPDPVQTDNNGRYSFNIPLNNDGGTVSASYQASENSDVLYSNENNFDKLVSNSDLGIIYVEQPVYIRGTIQYDGGRPFEQGNLVEAFTSRNHNGVIQRESYFTEVGENGAFEVRVAHEHTYVIQLVFGENVWYSNDIPVSTSDVDNVKITLNEADTITVTVDLNNGFIDRPMDASWTKIYDEQGKPYYTRKCTKGTTVNSITDAWNIAGIVCPLSDGMQQMLGPWDITVSGSAYEGEDLENDTKFTATYIPLHNDVNISFSVATGQKDLGIVSAPGGLTKVPYGSTYKIYNDGKMRITYRDNMTNATVSVSAGSFGDTFYGFNKWTNGIVDPVPSEGSILEETNNFVCYFAEKPPITGCSFEINVSGDITTEGCILTWSGGEAPTELSYGIRYKVDGSKLIFTKDNISFDCTASVSPEQQENKRFLGWKIQESDEADMADIKTTDQRLTKTVKFYACFIPRGNVVIKYNLVDEKKSHGQFEEYAPRESEDSSYKAVQKRTYKSLTHSGKAGEYEFPQVLASSDDYDNDNMRYELRYWECYIDEEKQEQTYENPIMNPNDLLDKKEHDYWDDKTVTFVAYMAAPKAVYDKSSKVMTFVFNDWDDLDDNKVRRYYVDKDCYVNHKDIYSSKFPNWLYDDGTPKVWPTKVVFDDSFKDVKDIKSTAGWFMNILQNKSDEGTQSSGGQDIGEKLSNGIGNSIFTVQQEVISQETSQVASNVRTREIKSIEGWDNFDYHSLTDTSYMFASFNCEDTPFTDFNFLKKWFPLNSQDGVPKITRADYMFAGSIYATEIPISPTAFDYASVEGMFYKCKSITNLNLSINFAGLYDDDIEPYDRSFDNLFYYCEKLNQLTISGDENHEKTFGKCVTTCNHMFYNCSNFQGINTHGATVYFGEYCEDFSSAFENCSSMQYLGIKLKSSFELTPVEDTDKYIIDISTDESWESVYAARYAEKMFKNCNRLISLDLSNFVLTNNWRYIIHSELNYDKWSSPCDEMLSGCESLTEYLFNGATYRLLDEWYTLSDFNLPSLPLGDIYSKWYCDFVNVEVGSESPIPEAYHYFYDYEVSSEVLKQRGVLWESDSGNWVTGDTEIFTFRKCAAYALVDNNVGTMTFKYFGNESPINVPFGTDAYRVVDSYYSIDWDSFVTPTWYKYSNDWRNPIPLTSKITKRDNYEVIFDPSFIAYQPRGLALWFAADNWGRQPYRFTENTHFEYINTEYVATTLSMFGGIDSKATENEASWRWSFGTIDYVIREGISPWQNETDKLTNETDRKTHADYQNSRNNNICNDEVETRSYNIESIDISAFGPLFNCSGMFAGCAGLKKVVLPENFSPGYIQSDIPGNVKFTENVLLISMFSGCISLQEIEHLDKTQFYKYQLSDNSVQVFTRNMFENCSSIERLDLSWLWGNSDNGLSELENKGNPVFVDYIAERNSYMLSGCSKLAEVKFSGKFSYDGLCDQNSGRSIKELLDLPDTFDYSWWEDVRSWKEKDKEEDKKFAYDLYIEQDRLTMDEFITFAREVPVGKSITFKVSDDSKEYGIVSMNEYEVFSTVFFKFEKDASGIPVLKISPNDDYAFCKTVVPIPSKELGHQGKFEYWSISGNNQPDTIVADWNLPEKQSSRYYTMDSGPLVFTAHFSPAAMSAKAVYGNRNINNTNETALSFYYDDKDHSKDDGVIEVFDVPTQSYVRDMAQGDNSNNRYHLNLPPWYKIIGVSEQYHQQAAEEAMPFENYFNTNTNTVGSSSASSTARLTNNIYDLKSQFVKTKVEDANCVVFDESFKAYNQLASISGWFVADSDDNQPFSKFYSFSNGTYTENMSNLPTSNIAVYDYAFGGFLHTTCSYDSSTVLGDSYTSSTSIKNVDFSNNTFNSVISAIGMFANCFNLTNIVFPEQDGISVKDAAYIFANCENLTTLENTNFYKLDFTHTTSYNNSLRGLFFGCSNLTKINLNNCATEDNTWWYPSNIFTDCYALNEITYNDNWNTNLYDAGLSDIEESVWKEVNGRYGEETFKSWQLPFDEQGKKTGTFVREIPEAANLELYVHKDAHEEPGGTIDGEQTQNYYFMDNVRIRVDQKDSSILLVDNQKYQAVPKENMKFKYWRFTNGFGDKLENTVISNNFDEVFLRSDLDSNLKIEAVFDSENAKVQVMFYVDNDRMGTFKFVYSTPNEIRQMIKAGSSNSNDNEGGLVSIYDVDDNCSIDNLPSWYYGKTESWFKDETREIPAFRKEIERNCQHIRVQFDESMKDYDGLRSLSCWFMPAISNSNTSVLYNPFASEEDLNIDFANLNTSNIDNYSRIFGGYEYANDLFGSGISKIVISNLGKDFDVKSISGMFRNCVALQRVYFNDCNFENLTDVSYLFANCPSFTLDGNQSSQIDTLAQIDFSNVTNMSYMYSGLAANDWYYTSGYHPAVFNFDTSSVTNMEGMFANNTNFSNIEIIANEDFDSSNVKNMSSMFENCESLENINIYTTEQQSKLNDDNQRLLNTTSVTNMSRMFYNCRNLNGTQLVNDLYDFDRSGSHSIWHNLSFDNAKDISYMFSGCNCIENVEFRCLNNVSAPIEIDNVTSMFSDCPISYVNFGNLHFRYNTDYSMWTNPTYGLNTVFLSSSRDQLHDYNGRYLGLEKINFGEYYNFECNLQLLGIAYDGYIRDYGYTATCGWTFKYTNKDGIFDAYRTASDWTQNHSTPLSKEVWDDTAQKYVIIGQPGTYEIGIRSLQLQCTQNRWLNYVWHYTNCKIFADDSQQELIDEVICDTDNLFLPSYFGDVTLGPITPVYYEFNPERIKQIKVPITFSFIDGTQDITYYAVFGFTEPEKFTESSYLYFDDDESMWRHSNDGWGNQTGWGPFSLKANNTFIMDRNCYYFRFWIYEISDYTS